MIQFTKMQGTGNDYIIIDCRKRPLTRIPACARSMCDRHYGIGSDGLLLLLNSRKADFRMRMFNPDGTEAEMCGNGIRCFAAHLYEGGMTTKKSLEIETAAGIKQLDVAVKNGRIAGVTVAMGEPVLRRERIPMAGDPGPAINESIRLTDGTRFAVTALSMGNPHAVIFVEDIDNFPVEKYGPMIESHHLFPNRTNVEFVKVLSRLEVIQRTWERGAGETLSCGTGASAVTVACVLNNVTERKIAIRVRGGRLRTEWRDKDNRVYLTGPARSVFRGEWPG